jgi:hypothetical protein
MRPLNTLALMLAIAGMTAVSACTEQASSTDASTSSSSSGSPGSCTEHAQCPNGFACRSVTRECFTSCSSTQAIIGGCVVGATCNNTQCDKNVTCNETSDCAYDKGEVCQFSSHTCVAASETCSEGEAETVCANGYTCHVSVCYLDCEGSKGCPSGKTCVNNACS